MKLTANPRLGPRPSIDDVLMRIAWEWEKRSTCTRNQVGAVIAKNGRHIGSGYNGAPAGMPHCNHTVSVKDPYLPTLGCTTAIHAEANAIAYAARDGVSVEGATMYVTLSPCLSCSQLMVAAGLTRVVYGRPYRDPSGIHLLDEAGVTVEKWIN